MVETSDGDDAAGSAGAASSGVAGRSGSGGGLSGASGANGANGASGASGAGAGGTVTSECGLLQSPAEVEPNGDVSQATAITLNEPTRGCLGSNRELDTFSFRTPADGTGGGVLLEFTKVGEGLATPTGSISVHVRTEGDNGDLFSTYTATAGGNLSAYFATAAGRTYYLQVDAFGGEKFAYTMKATYTPVADAFEPNDTKETATPIALNTPYSAYYFAGYESSVSPGDDQLQDFYAIELAAGDATVTLTNPPSTYAASIRVIAPSGEPAGTGYTPTAGANLTVDVTAPTNGTYYVDVRSFGSGALAGTATALPEHFTKPYQLTVTQP